MALVKNTGSGIMSGKVGGMVFQRNGRVRSYKVPTNPRTALQDAARAAFVTVAAGFAALTSGQQDAWKAWGLANPRTNRVGDSLPLTGKQAYMSLNGPRLLAGSAAIAEAPAMGQLILTPVGAGPSGGIAATLADLTLEDLMLAAGQHAAVFVGAPRSAASQRGRKSLRLAGSIEGAVTPVTTGSVVLPSGNASEGDVYDVEIIVYSAGTFDLVKYSMTVVAAS